MSTPSRVLVTGASGFVGSRLCTALQAAGLEVHAVVRDPARAPPGTEAHVTDIADAAGMARIGGEVRPEVVFHLAALHGRAAESATAPEPYRTNVEGVRTTLAATRNARRFVLLSTAALAAATVRGRYAGSKAEAERVVSQAGREIVAIRLSTCFGPEDRSDRLVPYVMRKLATNQPAQLTVGTTTRDYVYVDDAVHAISRAGMHPTPPPAACLDLCSGTPRTVRDMATRAAKAIAPNRLELLEFGTRAQGGHESAALPQSPEALRAWLELPAPTPLDIALDATAQWIRQEAGIGAA